MAGLFFCEVSARNSARNWTFDENTFLVSSQSDFQVKTVWKYSVAYCISKLLNCIGFLYELAVCSDGMTEAKPRLFRQNRPASEYIICMKLKGNTSKPAQMKSSFTKICEAKKIGKNKSLGKTSFFFTGKTSYARRMFM